MGKKIAIIYLDDNTTQEVKLSNDIFDDEVSLIESHIINNKFFKAQHQYINMLHIIKIEVKDKFIGGGNE